MKYFLFEKIENLFKLPVLRIYKNSLTIKETICFR